MSGISWKSNSILMKAAIAGWSLAISAHALNADDSKLAKDALTCAQLPVAADRHNCIDALALLLSQNKSKNGSSSIKAKNPRSTAQTTPGHSSPSPQAQQSQKLQVTESQTFGAEQLEQPRKKKDKKEADKSRVMVQVVRTRKHANNIVSYYLKNGQVWRQTEGVYAGSLKAPFSAEIKKGTLSGYRMRIEGSKHFVRVRRIK